MGSVTTFGIDAWACLRPGVYTCLAEPDAVTIGCVLGDDHTLLVDTGSSPDQGAELAASVRDQLGRTVDVAVVTHGHTDHWFGLAGLPGVASWGHVALQREAHDCVDAQVAYEYGFSPELIVPPANLVAAEAWIDLGERRVELICCGPAHSNTDLIVAVPDADLIFMGDLIEEAGDPCFGADCTPSRWVAAIRHALICAGPDTLLVPGHGVPVRPDFAEAQAEALRALCRRIGALWRSGIRLPDALNSLDVPAEVPWPFELGTVRKALVLAYAELGKRPD